MEKRELKIKVSEIICHLGGDRFTHMTEIRNFNYGVTSDGNDVWLTMKISRDPSDIRLIRITAKHGGMFDIVFYNQWSGSKAGKIFFPKMSKFHDVLGSDLEKIFVEVTKIDTGLNLI